jgi:hypothetical protein
MFWNKKKGPADMSLEAVKERLIERRPWNKLNEDDKRDIVTMLHHEVELSELVERLKNANSMLIALTAMQAALVRKNEEEAAKPKKRGPGRPPNKEK